MSYIIAIAGKGGTGKTTLASLLIRILVKRKRRAVLGIDADPNSNLAESLGLAIKEDIGSIVDSIAKNPDSVPQGMSKDMFINYRIQTSIIEEDGFDILTMGRPEGPGCYCYVNNLLRGLMKRLSDSYDYIVIDNEAGFEHLSRRTTRRADCLLVVSDPSQASLRAAKRIVGLVKELDLEIKKIGLVLNRCNGNLTKDRTKDLDIGLAGVIPEDEALLNLSLKGEPLTFLSDSSKAFVKLEALVEKICCLNETKYKF